MHHHHFNDAVVANYPFAFAGKKAVAVEVVEAVHIELTRYEFMQERLVVGIFKDF